MERRSRTLRWQELSSNPPRLCDAEKLDYLAELRQKIVIIEYGIESIHENLRRITVATATQSVKAVEETAARGITGALYLDSRREPGR